MTAAAATAALFLVLALVFYTPVAIFGGFISIAVLIVCVVFAALIVFVLALGVLVAVSFVVGICCGMIDMIWHRPQGKRAGIKPWV